MISFEELFEWEGIGNVLASSLRWLQGLGVPSFLAIVLRGGESAPGGVSPTCMPSDGSILDVVDLADKWRHCLFIVGK